MKTKTYIILILVAGLGFGLFVGSLIPAISPTTHQKIANRIEIVDTRSNFKLEPSLAKSESFTLGEGLAITQLALFTEGQSYQQTTWIWNREDESEWSMTITGPDDVGSSYIVEFGRLSPGSFDVYVDQILKASFAQSYVTPVDGYWWIEVQQLE